MHELIRFQTHVEIMHELIGFQIQGEGLTLLAPCLLLGPHSGLSDLGP